MLESVENYIDELQQNINYTQDFVKKLRGGRTRLVNSIEKAEEATKSAKNETKYVANIKEQLKPVILSNVKALLFGNALAAIRENYEFDSPPYRNGLFLAIESSDTYIIRSKGSGFKSILSVDIDLNRTAGRLNFWAAGVKAYRKILEQEKEANRKKKTKKGKERPKPKYDPIKASQAWAGIFDRREGTFSQFSVTIRQRLELSGRPAPFWQLLDKGELSMPSDRGGYPTPNKKATNFVKDTEDSIKVFASNLLAKEQVKYEELMSNYQTALNGAETSLVELDSLIDEIRLDSKQIQNLGRRADKVLKANYITKLEKAVQLIREGLITTKGLQLAIKGSYKGKRFSIETMAGLLQ